MITGLQTGDANLFNAAAQAMRANAADVGGNNVPITGGADNADGLTATQVPSQASTPVATNQGGTSSASNATKNMVAAHTGTQVAGMQTDHMQRTSGHHLAHMGH
jgi:hypothetical protein